MRPAQNDGRTQTVESGSAKKGGARAAPRPQFFHSSSFRPSLVDRRSRRVLSLLAFMMLSGTLGLCLLRSGQAMECEQYWDVTLIEASDRSSVYDSIDTADTGPPPGAAWVSSQISAIKVYGPGKTPGYEVELFVNRDIYMLLTLEDR